MKLVDALRLTTPDWQPLRLAIVGAGGKTSLLIHLSRELLSYQYAEHILITTTTHLATHQAALVDHHFIVENQDDLVRVFQHLPSGVFLFSGTPVKEGKTERPDDKTLAMLVELAEKHRLPLLVEADGSRRRPIKAPAEHEPAIPDWANYVVVMANMEALGMPVSEEWIHRPESFMTLVNQTLGAVSQEEKISTGMLGAVLTHPQGGLKGIPEISRRVVMLNGASTSNLAAQARGLKKTLLEVFESVVVADLPNINAAENISQSRLPAVEPVLAVYERAAGIILAAGGSSRLEAENKDRGNAIPGKPRVLHHKQLLPWRGSPFITHVGRTALKADLDQLIVVTGSEAPAVRQALAGFDVQFVHNPTWEEGQSTSLVSGLQALKPGVGSVIFFLSDQPQVPATLVQSLVELHSQTLSPLVAPQVAGRRANPVLFDRLTFPELLSLRGDTGGRVLFSKHPVSWLFWLDESILMDVDTWEDYEQLLISAEDPARLAAVVLAAGLSRRMGRPKMLLPWGKTSVIRHVVDILEEAGLHNIFVVTGSGKESIENELNNTQSHLVFNPKFADEEMIVSLQTGLTRLPEYIDIALIVLGDQPQIEAPIVRQLILEYHKTHHRLIIPSYQMRRGHPWLVHRSLWNEILSLQPHQTMRDFLALESNLIHYLVVDHPSILRDLDTMEDWEQEHP